MVLSPTVLHPVPARPLTFATKMLSPTILQLALLMLAAAIVMLSPTVTVLLSMPVRPLTIATMMFSHTVTHSVHARMLAKVIVKSSLRPPHIAINLMVTMMMIMMRAQMHARRAMKMTMVSDRYIN